MRACPLLRKFAFLCNAAHPERLRGTELRKHIATTCMGLNLEEHEVRDLADFMGHNPEIHKNIYRQPLIGRELRVSRFLEAAQGTSNVDLDAESEIETRETEIRSRSLKPKKRSSKYD